MDHLEHATGIIHLQQDYVEATVYKDHCMLQNIIPDAIQMQYADTDGNDIEIQWDS